VPLVRHVDRGKILEENGPPNPVFRDAEQLGSFS
jgi:hypothetical protein